MLGGTDSWDARYAEGERKAVHQPIYVPERLSLITPVFQELIVGQSSATFDNYQKQGLALDHFGMNKFENEEDGSYHQVRWQLVKMAEKSNRIMDGRGLGKTAHLGLLTARRHELQA